MKLKTVALSVFVAVSNLSPALAMAGTESTQTVAARDYVAVRNHAWYLSREADGLGDAATLLGFTQLHNEADAVRDAARNFRLLLREVTQGGTPNEAQLSAALAVVNAKFAELKVDWDKNPYSQNILLNNNYNKTQRELTTVMTLWGTR